MLLSFTDVRIWWFWLPRQSVHEQTKYFMITWLGENRIKSETWMNLRNICVLWVVLDIIMGFFLINQCFRSHIKILLIKQASSGALDLSHRHRLPASQLKWCNVITVSSGFLSLIDCDCHHYWAQSIPISPLIGSCVELSHWWWDSAPTHSEDISGHYAWVAPSRYHHVTLGPELRHDNNPIWMGHGIRHGHVLDIWPCHACCYCRALFCPGTWVDDLFFTITLTVVLPVTISRFVSQQRLWLLLPITWWHYIIHRQCAASSQLKLKIKLVQL